MLIQTKDLRACSGAVLTAVGVQQEDAEIIVDSILYAHTSAYAEAASGRQQTTKHNCRPNSGKYATIWNGSAMSTALA